ncbi:MAG: glucose-6-phosphate isomerase [Clostridia bacterium]
MIKFEEKYVYNVLSKTEIDNCIDENRKKLLACVNGQTGMKNFLGWFDVKTNATDEILAKNIEIAEEIKANADAFVVIGVGGSNRSALTLIEGLNKNDTGVKIFYGGNNLSGGYLLELLESLKDKNVYIDVIAKDFNTLEPGIAFRMFRKFLREKYGAKYNNRVILTGSFGQGQLFELSQKEDMRFLEFPKEVGGRFTAFTAVTFLPSLVANVDVNAFVDGGMQAEKLCKSTDLKNNLAVRYAIIRYLLSKKGFSVENLAHFEPRMENFCRWALQLHGESEGKNENSILPMITNFSEDLHAIGQYIQQGKKFIFETFLDVRTKNDLKIQNDDVFDGFDYLNNVDYDKMNDAVLEGSRKAHFEDGVPVMSFIGDKISEKTFGELMYVFMISTYMSAVLIDVEPFNQEGVENYKKNMYVLLGK